MVVLLNKDIDMSNQQQHKENVKRRGGNENTKHCRSELYLRKEDWEGKEAPHGKKRIERCICMYV
mgnify:FL=1